MPAYRPRPEDFRLHAHEPYTVLTERYGAGRKTLQRWREEIGIHRRPGAPRGNTNGGKGAGATDSRAQIRICLSCERPTCRGSCARLRLARMEAE